MHDRLTASDIKKMEEEIEDRKLQLRKELIEMENIFGLTPKGLKSIKTKGLESKKESAIDAALRKMSG